MKRPLFVTAMTLLLLLWAAALWGLWAAVALAVMLAGLIPLAPGWDPRQRRSLLGCLCCALVLAAGASAAFRYRLDRAARWTGETPESLKWGRPSTRPITWATRGH